MEQVFRGLGTIERARNAAIRWLEQRRVRFGPHRKVQIGRLGTFAGAETGVASDSGSRPPTDAGGGQFWRIRLDYDPAKGPHFNVEFGKGATAEKAAFCFEASEKTMQRIALRRRPRNSPVAD